MSDQTTCDCEGCTNTCTKAYRPKLEYWQKETGEYILDEHLKKCFVMNRCLDCTADHDSVMASTAKADKIRESYYVEVEYEVRTRERGPDSSGTDGSPGPMSNEFETTMETETKRYPLWHTISRKDIDEFGYILGRDDYYTKSSLGEAAIYIRNPETFNYGDNDQTYHINYIKVSKKIEFDF